MKVLRKAIFWLHLAIGVSVALVVLLMSVTGVLLTYERQTIAWADARGLDGSAPSADARPWPASALLEAAAADGPGRATAITWRNDPAAPVMVAFGRDGNRFLNAYTGEVLGDGSPRVRAFFTGLRDWHRWLGRAGDSRPLGRSITGAANLGFLFLVVSGFYLWWPRNWNPRALRNVVLFRGGLSGKARDFNWHNVIGFWSALPLAVVVASGVMISYPWATALVYRSVGDTPPPPPAQAAAPAAPDRESTPDAATPSFAEPNLDALRSRAVAYEPGWRSVSLALPEEGDAPLVFTLDRGNGGQPQQRGQLTFDRASGDVTKWEPFSATSPGRQLRSILRFAHTGEVLGIPGQTLAGLVSFGAVVLVWTGLALSLRRLSSWRKKTRPVPVSSYRSPVGVGGGSDR